MTVEKKSQEYINKIEPCDMVYNEFTGLNECRFNLEQFQQAYLNGYDQGKKYRIKLKKQLIILKNYIIANIPDGEKVYNTLIKKEINFVDKNKKGK